VLLSKSLTMQKIIFGAIRGDQTFQQLNQNLARQLPSILVQTMRGE
jgi:hypothetical protein